MSSKTVGRMSIGMRPRPGFNPTTPQSAAGMRTEPPMSVPSASGTQPLATATADPPDDPPALRAGSCGFRVTPQRGLRVKPEWANSGVVVLPTMMAPAAFRRRTITGSWVPGASETVHDPRVAGWPAEGVKSFSATGTPQRRPGSAPTSSAASSARAAAIASSRRMTVKGFRAD